MEQPPIKKGYLYRPQKGKGMGLKKCWVKRWAMLYPASETQLPRLETFDSKEVASKEGAKPTVLSLVGSFQANQTTMHRSRDFVLEISNDDKPIVYAVDSKEELDTWLQVFAEVAAGRSVKRTSLVPDLPSFGMEACEGLQENTLYDSYETITFDIAIKPTAFSDSLNLQGRYSLQIDSVKLSLLDENTNNLLYAWPYRYLRRYGRDKTSFSMEAGRKCDSGPGLIVFETKDGNDIFHNIQNFVNSISGRQATPPVQSQAAKDSQKHALHEPVRKPANPSKGPAKTPALTPRSHPMDPMSAMIAESSLFKQKQAERKEVEGQTDEPSVREHIMRRPKQYPVKTVKEQQPTPPKSEPDPLYSEVEENTGKGAGEPTLPIPEGEYALPEGSETHFRPQLPVHLPESSEYDLLDASNPPGHFYDTTVEEPLGDGWLIHGRTEDNIHTETYLKGLPILEYEDSGSDQEPAKPVPIKSKPPPKPTPLPKTRATVRAKTGIAPDAKRELAANDSSATMYDTVGSLPVPGASTAPTATDGQDTYDHFVRPAIAHPKPAPRKCNPSQAPQVDAESELYDHLQRETNTGAPRMTKPYVPKQRSLDPDDVYDELRVDDQGTSSSGASANVGAYTLPEESQYIEATRSLTPQQSVVDPGENNMEENPYDVVAFQ